MPNGSLVIYDVTTEDSGKYTCIAGNSCNIKHREAFLYVVGEGGAQPRDVASCHPGAALGPAAGVFRLPLPRSQRGFGKSLRALTGSLLSAPQTSRQQRRTRDPATTRPTR